MKFIPQLISDVVLIQPEIHGDSRGYFVETFRQDEFEQAIGRKIDFIQNNESKSSKGVLRGLHFQLPSFAQSKLVRVIKGKVLDVAVDIRKGSSTFGQSVVLELNDKNKYQLFVPRGFAHGFVVLSDSATFSYKVDNYYSPEHERGLAFDDKELGIDWKIPKDQLNLAKKDQNNPVLTQLEDHFDYTINYYDE
jgi:dTDP-4-dehydrorhamnose 3,5-epimerase